MNTCTFCGKTMSPGTGKIYVKKDSKIFYFCTSKCERNMLVLKHKPRTTKWTNEYNAIKKGLKK
jgi:large subunit ribosomal protein L24e